MRKNHTKHMCRDWREAYDCVYIELPEQPNVARVIVIPMKTIFINIAANPDANIDQLFYNVEDAQAFFDYWRVIFM